MSMEQNARANIFSMLSTSSKTDDDIQEAQGQ